jgi:hypothetical protein
MVFCVGLMTLGAARLLTGRRRGIGLVHIALAGVLMVQVRPHLLLISALAIAGSQLAGSMDAVGGRRGVLLRIALLAAFIPIAVSGLGRIDTLSGTTGGEDILASLDTTVRRTEIGGSAFSTFPVRTPLDIPPAAVSVIYRPFLFEARSVPVALSALEGTLLLALTIAAWRWIWRVVPIVTRTAFGAFCGIYVLGFVVAFSNIANAGILSRQRVQMYAVLMIIVAAAYETHRIHQRELAEPDAGPDGQPLASVGGSGRPAVAPPTPAPAPVPERLPVP